MKRLKVKRISSSNKAKLIQTDEGGFVLGVDNSNKYKTYDYPANNELVFQDWTAPIDAVITTDTDIGAHYNTSDGKTHAHITLTVTSGLDITLYMNKNNTATMTVDWGDGTTSDYTNSGYFNTGAHTYPAIGDYVIKIWISSGVGTYQLGNGTTTTTFVGGNTQAQRNTLIKLYIGDDGIGITTSGLMNCMYLGILTMPIGFTNMGNDCCRNCYALINIIVPYGVKLLGGFRDCSALTYILLPNSITSMIASNSFNGCTSLSTITIPNSVPTIAAAAFYGCTSLTSIVIPDNVTTLGGNVFNGCTSLRYAYIYANITTLSISVFQDCTSITSIVFPIGLTTINDTVFRNCTSLTVLNIPDGVTSIGANAFDGCTSMLEYVFKSALPPTITETTFNGIGANCKIYVPDANVNDYKTATNWTTVASRIFGISTMPVKTEASITLTEESGLDITLYMSKSDTSSMIVDWGDGTTNIYTNSGNFNTGVHIYPSIGDYVIKIWISAGAGTYSFGNDDTSTVFMGGNIQVQRNTVIKLIIGSNVVSISSAGAFMNCYYLKSVIFNNTSIIGSISSSTFYNCYALESIIVPYGITHISSMAFYNCRSLISVSLPTTIVDIGQESFRGCINLKFIYIPEDVIDLRVGSFWDCSSLKSVYIPTSITSLTAITFLYCTSLTSINLHDNINSIGYGTFAICYSLTSVKLSSILTAIPVLAFYNCHSLISLTIPAGVLSIAENAFQNCTSLVEYTFEPLEPPSITSTTFLNMNPNCIIYVPDASVTAYKTATNWLQFEYNIRPIGEKQTQAYITITNKSGYDVTLYFNKSDSSTLNVDWGDGNIDIYTNTGDFNTGAHTYRDIGNYIIKLWISDGIGTYTFGNGTNSTRFVGGDDYLQNLMLTKLVIGNNVTTIGDNAFFGHYNLSSVSIPHGVTSIGDYAFQACLGITDILLPASLTTIGSMAFNNTRISHVDIPSSVTTINGAFSSSSVKSVIIPGSITTLGGSIFSGCDLLEEAHIANGITSIPFYMFAECTSLKKIVIPYGVTSIGNHAFLACRALESVEIPDTVTVINVNAFQLCTALTKVTIPKNVTHINNFAFDGCTAIIEYMVYRPTPPSIGANTFRGINTNCKIYVPDDSVDAYKAATNWITLADHIYPMSSSILYDVYNVVRFMNYEGTILSNQMVYDGTYAIVPAIPSQYGEYLGGIFKSEDFTIKNATRNPDVYPQYDTDIKTKGAHGKLTKLLQYDNFTVGIQSETVSGVSVYCDATSSYVDVPANIALYNLHNDSELSLGETYFNNLSAPRFILSGIPHAYLTELPISQVYYNFDTAIIYGDTIVLKNAYDHEWNIDAQINFISGYDISITLDNTRTYINTNINNRDVWLSYKVGTKVTGYVTDNTFTEQYVHMDTVVDSQENSNLYIKDYEFIERIKGKNVTNSDELHKSNIFSVEINNSRLNENIDDIDMRTKIQLYINNVIREVITKISPVNTQLWKIEWKGN